MSRFFPAISPSTTRVPMPVERFWRLLLGLGCLFFLPAGPARAAEELNRILLRVNDQILTLFEYERRKAEMISAILQASDLETAERQRRLGEVGQQVMSQAFEELLVESRAEQLALKVEEAQVDAALAEIRQRQGIENEEQMLQVLTSMGLTLEDVRGNLRRELRMQQVMGREVQSKIEVGEEELRAIYRNQIDQFRVPEERQLKEVIVLESSVASASDRRRIAEEIRSQLEAGGDFAAVVEPYRGRGETTGVIDLGWLTSGEVEPLLAQAAFRLEVGKLSEPIEARGGTHVIQVEGIKPEEMRPFSEVQAEIQARERSKRFRRELRQYLAELEKNAYVQESLPPEAVGYRNVADEPEPDELELFHAPIAPPQEKASEAKKTDEGEAGKTASGGE